MFTHLSCHPLTSSHPYQDLQTCLDFGICIGTWSCEDLFYTHVHHKSCHSLTSCHPCQGLQTCLDFGICVGTWSCEDLFYTHVHHKSCHSLTSCHPCQDLQTCLTFGICVDAWACKDLFYTHVRSLVLSSRDIKSSRPGHTNLPGIWHLYCNVIVWRFVLHSCSPTCLVTRWHQVIWTVKQTCLSFGICCGTCSCKDLSYTLGFSNLPADSAFESSGICTVLDSKDLFTITLIQWSCHSLTLCLRR